MEQIQEGDLLGQPACTVLGVGELGAQAVLGNERVGRRPPCSVGTSLTLAVACGRDPRAEGLVRVEEW